MNFFGNNNNNSNNEQKQEQESNQMPPSEQMQKQFEETGANLAKKVEEGKDQLGSKTLETRGWMADNLDKLQHNIEPPHPEEPTMGDKLHNVKETAVDKIQHGKEALAEENEKFLDPEGYEARKQEEEKPTFEKDMEHVKEVAQDKTGEYQEVAQERADQARSWMADRVGDLKETVAPPEPEPEPTLTDKLGNVKNGLLDKLSSDDKESSEQRRN